MDVHEDGRADYELHNVRLEDYFNLQNALLDGASAEAEASFQIEWQGGGRHLAYGRRSQGFLGQFIEGTATIEWSAHNDRGFSYRSDDEDTSTTVFAAVGRERNGVFLREADDDDDEDGGE